MKDSIFNTIVFSIQLFICIYDTVRTSKCEMVEQKSVTKMEKNEVFYCMLASVYKLYVRVETGYYNNNFSTVQRITNHHVNNNNMLLSDENRTKCFH
jgi:hypothetical protein